MNAFINALYSEKTANANPSRDLRYVETCQWNEVSENNK